MTKRFGVQRRLNLMRLKGKRMSLWRIIFLNAMAPKSKPSYREVTTLAVTSPVVTKGNAIPEGSGTGNLADSVTVKETEDFGPWMIVHRPQRRKPISRKGADNSGINGNAANRFNALQMEVNEHDSATISSRDKEVRPNIARVRKSVKAGTQKQAKLMNNRPKTPQQQRPIAQKNQKSIVATVEPMQGVEENNIHENQDASLERKKREETVLRIMSQKQESAWKKFLAERNISDEILSQHVQQRSDEELAKIQILLQKEKWREIIGEEPHDHVAHGNKSDQNANELESSEVLQKGAVISSTAC
ncbi:hypothetical protein RIF29_05561 [Crotalaria pallida]|uniref:Uncharacterized protein n=1 Tax=Crotalaria pallida TaxID=3830 RepID=A0AAN9J3M4_CROPI